MDISVLHEDAEVIAVDKPAGLLVHPDGKSDERVLTEWILENYPTVEGVGEPLRQKKRKNISRPGIVHRLDRDTSGVLLIAKTQRSFEHLKEQFKKRKVRKTYLTFLYGILPEDRGVIDRPIGKSASDFRLWSAQRGARGKLRRAVTRYRVNELNENIETKSGTGLTFASVYPETGRTHQIRVHFKAIHHPIVCDSLYAPNHECLLSFDRLALHASEIEYMTTTGNTKKVEAPLPADFKKALELFKGSN